MNNTKTNKKFNFKLNNQLAPSMDWIVYDDDPRIRVKCKDVEEITPEDNELINKMVSYIN